MAVNNPGWRVGELRGCVKSNIAHTEASLGKGEPRRTPGSKTQL